MDKNFKLSRATMIENGLSPKAVQTFLDEIKKNHIELHSLLIAKDWSVVCEGYWKPYKNEYRHIMYSVSKTVSATAIGLLYDDGMIDVYKPLTEYFPEYAHLAKGYTRELTLHHLLSMNAGTEDFTTTEVCRNPEKPDWVANFFQLELTVKPGTHFQYNTPASYMLCRIVMELTKKKPLEFLQERLFDKMGIQGAQWDECPMGCNTGGWGLWMRSEDLLKIGLLYLHEGNYQGEQLLSKEWVDIISRHHSDTSRLGDSTEKGYGYQVWLNSIGGYRMWGLFGQYCFIIPQKNIVVVTNAGCHEAQKQVKLIQKMILELEGEGTSSQEEELRKQLETLEVLPLSKKDPSPIATGTTLSFEMEENDEDYREISFTFLEEGGFLTLELTEAQEKWVSVLPFGWGHWKEGSFVKKHGLMKYAGGVKRTVTSGQWEGDSLILELRFLETSFAQRWHCRFTNEKIEIIRRQNCGDHGLVELSTLIGKEKNHE